MGDTIEDGSKKVFLKKLFSEIGDVIMSFKGDCENINITVIVKNGSQSIDVITKPIFEENPVK